MKRIPGMTLNDQASYRRGLIHAALTGLCTRDQEPYRSIVDDAISIADKMIDRLATEPIRNDGYSRTYVVQPGDTLQTIGDRYRVVWRSIAKVNRIVNPDHIEPGWELIIPYE